jgi:hypothetical protein
MPNVPYEMGPNLPFQPPLQDFADIVAARFLDEFSQKAWWEFNLECLEERKKIAEEKKVSLERRLEAIMKKALDSPSHLGAGYNNFYNFVVSLPSHSVEIGVHGWLIGKLSQILVHSWQI